MELLLRVSVAAENTIAGRVVSGLQVLGFALCYMMIFTQRIRR